MKTTLTVQLLSQTLVLDDLSIGQAIDIAQIPQRYNEKRLSAFIGHLTGDLTLAGTLTAQERYKFLLSHQSITESNYSGDDDNDNYLIETIQSDVPKEVKVGSVTVSQLLGSHACVLESICEHVADWLHGQMACQLSGNLSSLVGGDNPNLNWPELLPSLTDSELNQTVQERVNIINKLSIANFNDLSDGYQAGIDQLAHFVRLGNDNDGLTLIAQGGEDEGEPSRFLTLDHINGTAGVLIQCFDG